MEKTLCCKCPVSKADTPTDEAVLSPAHHDPPFDFDALWNHDPSDDPQLAALVAAIPPGDNKKPLLDLLYRMREH
ncbi:MAG TPA: hypothetical protein VIO38_16890 [Rariglobus sp.]